MTPADGAIVLAGAAAIIWVNWYFFAPRQGVRAPAAAGRQEVRITVEGGYAPDRVVLQAGVPARLTFVRVETNPCSEEVVLPDFGIRRTLPPHQPTMVEFTPTAPGRYPFTCGMGMLRGELVVEASE